MANLNSSTKLKFKRSNTAGKRPEIADIEPGELFVNLADKSIHTSDGTEVIELGSKLTDNYLPLDGGTLTGPLTASKVLVSAAQATEANSLTRKDYVDKSIDALNTSTSELANTKVAKSGDTMIGKLTIDVKGVDPIFHVKSESANPVLIERTNANQNVSIAMRHTGGTRYLGFGIDGKLNWGVNADMNANGMVYTTEFKPNWNDVQAWRQGNSSLLNQNINDIIEPGSYYQTTNANALATLGYPVSQAGTLNVYRSGANGWGITQEYKEYTRNVTYTRNKNSATTWTEWSKTYSEHNKPTSAEVGAVSKTGDTMTGNLTVPVVLVSAAQNGAANSLTRKDYVDGRANEKVAKTGDTMTGALSVQGGVKSYGIHGLRLIRDNYGVIFRRSETNFYIIPTVSGQAENGDIGPLRPFYINCETGAVSMSHQVTVGGNLNVGGTVTTGTGYGLKTDGIARRDGTAFIAADGNINIPTGGSNGFTAGWVLGQINTRLNNAQTAATNANNNANGRLNQAQVDARVTAVGDGRFKKKTKGWTQVWSGSAGGGASAALSQDVRFRSIWIQSNGYYNPIKIGPDGLYFLASEGGWIKFRILNNGRTLKNESDERSIPKAIFVENE